MAVDIGPKIGIDGEKEFRQNLNNINQQLRTLGSEMKSVTSAFGDGDDAEDNLAKTTDILNRQIETQEQKLSELRKGLEKASDKFGEADSKTMRWKQAVYDATTELNNMKRSLEKVEDGIDDVNDATEDTGFSFDDLSGIMKKGFAVGAVGAVVAGAKEVCEAMIEIVDETQEYRTIMASLESSSQAAGYSAEETAETYRQLQGVLGDAQTAATATANLQAIGLEQDKLTDIANAAIGAWARYGDSIPIDGLAEAINETIQVGKVTGSFADVLNWAGLSEDDFNEKLQEVNGSTERANIVLKALADEGLIQAGEAWRENNEDIVAYNESQDAFDEAMAELGEVLAPAATAIKNFGADAIEWLTEVLKKAIDWADKFIDRIETMNKKAKDVPTGVMNFDYYKTDGSHAGGLSYVPFDGYTAELHKGEMILTSSQAAMVRAANAGSNIGTIAAGLVNGMQTVMAGGGGNYRIEIPIEVNGVEFSRAIISDLRGVMNDNPEVI